MRKGSVKIKGFSASSTKKSKPVASGTPSKAKGKPLGNGVEVVPDDSNAGLDAKSITNGVIDVPDGGTTPEELKARSFQLSTQVSKYEVVDSKSLQNAADVLVNIKNAKAKAELWLGPQKKSAWDAYQVALGQYKAAVDPLDAATKLLKIKMSDYQLEQEKLAEEARQEAEELDGEELMDAITASAVTGMEKAKGVSSTRDFDVIITDVEALVEAVVHGEVNIKLDNLVTVKPSIVKAFIKTTGIEDVPGVKVKPKITQAVTGRK